MPTLIKNTMDDVYTFLIKRRDSNRALLRFLTTNHHAHLTRWVDLEEDVSEV